MHHHTIATSICHWSSVQWTKMRNLSEYNTGQTKIWRQVITNKIYVMIIILIISPISNKIQYYKHYIIPVQSPICMRCGPSMSVLKLLHWLALLSSCLDQCQVGKLTNAKFALLQVELHSVLSAMHICMVFKLVRQSQNHIANHSIHSELFVWNGSQGSTDEFIIT